MHIKPLCSHSRSPSVMHWVQLAVPPPSPDLPRSAPKTASKTRARSYACLNATLRAYGVYCSRDCVKASFDSPDKGLPFVSRLALANARDLLPLIK